MEFPAHYFDFSQPSLSWDLYNHPEHRFWFWADTRHFQPCHPGAQHRAWLTVRALEMLLAESCLHPESYPLHLHALSPLRIWGLAWMTSPAGPPSVVSHLWVT